MGIQGLLPLLKSTMHPIHIKDLQGCSVAIDTYSWLHKGALSCSTQLCKGLPTSRHIDYCMHRVNLLRHHGVKPVLVFDGGFLPMKLEQENKRARSRKENLARAIEHESNGNSSAAYECYQKAVDISPTIAYDLIQVLKHESVSYVVAPYEADAQMTFLAVSKKVDAVITEDSDLIAFGCPRIIFKMDKYGHGVEFQFSRLHTNKELSFSGFTSQMVLEMCILSGCDYLPSLPGMGLKRAHALISKFKTYEKVIKHLKYSTVSIPPVYEESFKKAILTFRHQRVFDPIAEDIVHLSDVPEGQDGDWEFVGPRIPQDVAKGIAIGDLDPFTQMPFQGDTLTSVAVLSGTSKAKNSKPESTAKKIDLPVQKNLLTNYFCFASIEAKRKFKTPRKSPTSSSPVGSSSQKEPCYIAADSGRISCSSASPSASEKPSSTSPHTMMQCLSESKFSEPTSYENGNLGDMPLKAFGQSLHQSGQAVLKECESKNNQKQGTQVAECKKVIVRSRYFQHKPKNNESEESEETPRSSDERARAMSPYFAQKSSLEDSDRKDDTAFQNVGSGEIFFGEVTLKRKKRKTSLNDNVNRSKDFCANASLEENNTGCSSLEPDEEEVTEEQTKGKKFEASIVRSRYFQHMATNDESQECKEMPRSYDGRARVASPYFAQKSSPEDVDREDDTAFRNGGSSERNSSEVTLKRKTSLNDNVSKGSRRSKYFCSNASPENNNTGCSSLELDKEGSMDEQIEGEKFGASIKHLSRYSEIAEKSVDRFASMLSSFRYSSNGSRASGLRAPLKDIKNTCNTTRSTIVPDFSEFAYAPKNKGTASSASMRR